MNIDNMLGLLDDIREYVGWLEDELQTAKREDENDQPSMDIIEDAMDNIDIVLNKMRYDINDM